MVVMVVMMVVVMMVTISDDDDLRFRRNENTCECNNSDQREEPATQTCHE
jgi:hypothetical protein